MGVLGQRPHQPRAIEDQPAEVGRLSLERTTVDTARGARAAPDLTLGTRTSILRGDRGEVSGRPRRGSPREAGRGDRGCGFKGISPRARFDRGGNGAPAWRAPRRNAAAAETGRGAHASWWKRFRSGPRRPRRSYGIGPDRGRETPRSLWITRTPRRRPETRHGRTMHPAALAVGGRGTSAPPTGRVPLLRPDQHARAVLTGS